MGKPSKLTIGDITLEISPDMTPEQIQAMISSIAALKNNVDATPIQKKQTQNNKKESLEPIQIFQKGTWMDKIALFVRNEYKDTLEFTVSDVQLGFQTLFNVILEKAAITTYLNRLAEKGFVTKTKPIGSRSHQYKATAMLIQTYPEIDLSQLQAIATKILQ